MCYIKDKYKYKVTNTHKDIVNFQVDVLGYKCIPSFYQRQCGVAKALLTKYTLEEVLTVLAYFKETGVPKNYKSIYYLREHIDFFVPVAKVYFLDIKEKKKELGQVVNSISKRNYVSNTRF